MKGPVRNHLHVELIEGVAVVHFLDREIIDSFGERDDVWEVRGQLYSLVEEGGLVRLVLDFGPVEFMSTIMLGVLVKLRAKVEQAGGWMALCGLSPVNQQALR